MTIAHPSPSRPAHSQEAAAITAPPRVQPVRLVIQIPCYNEEESLPETLAALPRAIPGVDILEVQIINDGSKDRTVEVARAHGVDHIVDLPVNKGLSNAFMAGLEHALANCIQLIHRGAQFLQLRGISRRQAG